MTAYFLFYMTTVYKQINTHLNLIKREAERNSSRDWKFNEALQSLESQLTQVQLACKSMRAPNSCSVFSKHDSEQQHQENKQIMELTWGSLSMLIFTSTAKRNRFGTQHRKSKARENTSLSHMYIVIIEPAVLILSGSRKGRDAPPFSTSA